MKDNHKKAIEPDAEKIAKHIKYTRHWLDKADDDFSEHKMASGSAVLNLARAELTAAWEEAMQLKTQVIADLPQKAKANWKPLTSVGLLASGFIVAIMINNYSPTSIPGSGPKIEDSSTPPPITATVVIPESHRKSTPAATQPQTVPSTTAATSRTTTPSATPAHAKAPRPQPAITKTIPSAVATPAQVPQPQVIERVKYLPYSPLTDQDTQNAQPVTAQSQSSTRQLEQNEVIELYKTAEHSLR